MRDAARLRRVAMCPRDNHLAQSVRPSFIFTIRHLPSDLHTLVWAQSASDPTPQCIAGKPSAFFAVQFPEYAQSALALQPAGVAVQYSSTTLQ